MNACEYFDATKSALDIKSDYALAKCLGVTQGRISAIRNGKAAGFDAELSIKIADVLKIDPLSVIADMEMARKNANIGFWEGVRAKSTGTAAAIFAGVALTAAPTVSEASTVVTTAFSSNPVLAVICIMRVLRIIERAFKLAIWDRFRCLRIRHIRTPIYA